MLRGVNKRVVEITATDNEYFERAILIVRCDKYNTNSNIIDKNAQSFLRDVTCDNITVTNFERVKREVRRRVLFRRLALVGSCIGLLASIATIIFFVVR